MTTTSITMATTTREIRFVGSNNYFRQIYMYGHGPGNVHICMCVHGVLIHMYNIYIRGDNGGMVLMGNRLPTSSETNGIDFRRGRMSGMLSIVL